MQRNNKHKLNSAFSFKNNVVIIVVIILLICYLIVGHNHDLYVPCIFHLVTGLWCPGCGITRMLFSIITGDFKEAFYYNQLLFISSPIFLFFFIENIYAKLKNKKPMYLKVPNIVYYLYIVLLVLFMILRNIFPQIAPPSI